jgi:hypothetical protein
LIHTAQQLRRQRLTRSALLALCALCATGCLAERRLIIESDPPGALVELDWKPVGHTPLELTLEHAGRRRLFVTLEGHEPILRDIEFASTWRSSFPFDIFTELLHPFPEDEVQVVKLQLSQRVDRGPTDLAPVLERAEMLRRAGPSGPADLGARR